MKGAAADMPARREESSVPPTNRTLVVSIHDVAPSTQRIANKILTELAEHGVHVTSLLVVPNYHREGSALKELLFSGWLKKLEEHGHEIVIHGYFHERARRNDESFLQKFITRFYTADEGEFYDIIYSDALRLISDARDEFERHGLSPVGFIAPAWLLSAQGEQAAGAAGMIYTTRLGSMHHLLTNKTFRSQSLVYSTRSAWRRIASLAWNRSVFWQQWHNSLLRVSIHPSDPSHPRIWRQILRFVDRALADRTPVTYRSWIAADQATAKNPES
ncbi:MAG: polysaccharide deacetylase family protein [Verrucomicrobiota bacterium]